MIDTDIVEDLQERFDNLLGIGPDDDRAWTDLDGVDNVVLFHGEVDSVPSTITRLLVQSQAATQRRRMRP
jgi:hypothetical protein